MREILCRGKRLDNGEWVEGYYVSHQHVAHYIIPVSPGGYEAADGSFYVAKWYKVDPATVGRYIGQEDMNGERIFEGDIALYAGDNVVVEWDDDDARFRARALDGTNWTFDFSVGWGHTLEVIGNIHDNPDLLGGN